MLIEVINGYFIKEHTYGHFVVNNVREEENDKGELVTVYDTVPASNSDLEGCIKKIAKEIASNKEKTTIKNYLKELKEVTKEIKEIVKI